MGGLLCAGGDFAAAAGAMAEDKEQRTTSALLWPGKLRMFPLQ